MHLSRHAYIEHVFRLREPDGWRWCTTAVQHNVCYYNLYITLYYVRVNAAALDAYIYYKIYTIDINSLARGRPTDARRASFAPKPDRAAASADDYPCTQRVVVMMERIRTAYMRARTYILRYCVHVPGAT